MREIERGLSLCCEELSDGLTAPTNRVGSWEPAKFHTVKPGTAVLFIFHYPPPPKVWLVLHYAIYELANGTYVRTVR